MSLTREQDEAKARERAKAIETAKHIARTFASSDGQAVLQHLSTLFFWNNKVNPGVNNAADLRAYADGQQSVLTYIHEQINFASNH